MDRRLPVKSLTGVGTVVDLLLLSQVPIAVPCPGCPPPFRILPVVPVVRRDIDFLPEVFGPFAFPDPCFLHPVFVKDGTAVPGSMLPVFRVIGRQRRVIYSPAFCVPGIGEYGPCFLLPLFLFIESPHRQHDMCVGIAVPFVMQRPVGDHAFRYKVFLNEAPDAFDLLFPFHLSRECNFDFPGQLRVRTLFGFLHFVPQDLPVLISRRCMFRKQDLVHYDTVLCSKVMDDPGFVIQQFLTGPVCGGCHRGPAGGAADDLDRAVVD